MIHTADTHDTHPIATQDSALDPDTNAMRLSGTNSPKQMCKREVSTSLPGQHAGAVCFMARVVRASRKNLLDLLEKMFWMFELRVPDPAVLHLCVRQCMTLFTSEST